MRRVIANEYVYCGMGFPVTLHNVPMIKIMGEWAPDINYNEIEDYVVSLLAQQVLPLTGKTAHFLRLRMNLPVRDLAPLLGTSQQAIDAWEEMGDKTIPMSTEFEKQILETLARP